MRPVRVLLFVAAAGLAALVAADAVLDVRPAAVAPPETEDPAARAAGIRAAFSGPAAVTPAEPDFAAFFAALGSAAARKDAVAGGDLFDTDRLYAEALDAIFPRPEPDDRQTGAKVRSAVWDGFAVGWLGGGWEETRVRRVDRLPGGSEAVVYARHRTAAGSVPARWWLVRRRDGWQAYDVEDVRLGLRLSHQLAALLDVRAGDAEHASLQQGMTALAAAATALAERDVPKAAAALGPARAARLPAPLRAVLCLTEAAVALGANDPAAALAQADEADRVRPGIPGADLIRATAYFRQRRWPEAAAAARRYTDLLGPDPQASLILGLSQFELGDPAAAEAALRPAAEEFPADIILADALSRLHAGR